MSDANFSEAVEKLYALARVEGERIALERIAQKLENRAGCAVYQQAWKIAAREARAMKPDGIVNDLCMARGSDVAVSR